jgi:hypothetical protein
MKLHAYPRVAGIAGQLMLALMLSACSPALNWRQVRPVDSGVEALFPCKPDQVSRQVLLAGAPIRMQLASCSADGAVFALGHADVANAGSVNTSLAELMKAAVSNVGDARPVVSNWTVRGAVAHPGGQHLILKAQRPGGRTLGMHAVFFAHGTRVYQASVVGSRIDVSAAETFFAALKLPS